jgi:hypothetical protein
MGYKPASEFQPNAAMARDGNAAETLCVFKDQSDFFLIRRATEPNTKDRVAQHLQTASTFPPARAKVPTRIDCRRTTGLFRPNLVRNCDAVSSSIRVY